MTQKALEGKDYPSPIEENLKPFLYDRNILLILPILNV